MTERKVDDNLPYGAEQRPRPEHARTTVEYERRQWEGDVKSEGGYRVPGKLLAEFVAAAQKRRQARPSRWRRLWHGLWRTWYAVTDWLCGLRTLIPPRDFAPQRSIAELQWLEVAIKSTLKIGELRHRLERVQLVARRLLADLYRAMDNGSDDYISPEPPFGPACKQCLRYYRGDHCPRCGAER